MLTTTPLESIESTTLPTSTRPSTRITRRVPGRLTTKPKRRPRTLFYHLFSKSRGTRKGRTRLPYPTNNRCADYSYILEDYFPKYAQHFFEEKTTNFRKEFRKEVREHFDYDPFYVRFYEWLHMAMGDKRRVRWRERFEMKHTGEFNYTALLHSTPYPIVKDYMNFWARVNEIERFYNLTTRIRIFGDYDFAPYLYSPIY